MYSMSPGSAVADRLIAAARDTLPSRDAPVARQMLAADLSLLSSLEEQVQAAEASMIQLSPKTVASHLYRSYPKLGIAGRHQLRDVIDQESTPRVSG